MATKTSSAASLGRHAMIRAFVRAMRVRRTISVSVLVHARMAATDGNLGVAQKTAGPSVLSAKVERRRLVVKAIVEVRHADVTAIQRVSSSATAAKTSRITVVVWTSFASSSRTVEAMVGATRNSHCTSSTLVPKSPVISIPLRRVQGLDGSAQTTKSRKLSLKAKKAQIQWSLQTLKGEELAVGGYGETAFGVDSYASKGCPTRLFKKMGRYSLKQIIKKNDANGDVLNIFKHMTRRADRLGLYDAESDFV